MKPLAALAAVATAVLVVGCLAQPSPDVATVPTPITKPAASSGSGETVRPFAWTGVFDIVGDGFPDGMRSAIIIVTPRDTSFDFFIEGPPGTLMSSRFDRDSLHVLWDMYGEPMYVELRGVADSLDGRWRIGDRGGRIWGARRK
jgi:hypothetical protein